MLTFEQKSNVRRHLGYPVAGLLQVSPAGGSVASGSIGYRFFQIFGQLEYKMNNLNPDEEARLLGRSVCAILLGGPQPNPGDTISATLTGGGLGSPVTHTATAGTPGGDVRLFMGADLVSAFASDAAIQAANIYAMTPYGSGPYSLNQVPNPEIMFTAASAMTIAASGSGKLYPQVVASGALLSPSASLDGATTLYGYLNILDGLEAAYAGTSQNLDTMQAAVWKGRANEAGQRASLYRVWQGMLADFLGIPVNRSRFDDAKKHGAMRFA